MYRNIVEIRAEQEQFRLEQSRQGDKIAHVESKVDEMALGQREMMNFLRGGLEPDAPPGLKHQVDEHAERLASLERSRDQAAPLVASQLRRHKDWATAKGVVIGAAVLTAWEYFKNLITGKHP